MEQEDTVRTAWPNLKGNGRFSIRDVAQPGRRKALSLEKAHRDGATVTCHYTQYPAIST
jgi:hypothetical protein